MPGFIFRTFPKSKLPQVAVPFVLDLSHSDVTDAGLKDLAGLNNLAELHGRQGGTRGAEKGSGVKMRKNPMAEQSAPAGRRP
jgi:hypothetical protein